MSETKTTKKPTQAKKITKAEAIVEASNELQNIERKWEVKNRVYHLTGSIAKSPFFKLQSEDRPPKKRLLAWDEEAGKQRSIRYAVNLDSPYIDEQDGDIVVQEQVVFSYGVLTVDRKDVALQKFLEVHPWNKKNGGKMFYEHDPAEVARKEINALEQEAEAMSTAFQMELSESEAILRPVVGPGVRDMKPEVVKREILRYAKTQPANFLRDAKSDKTFIKGAIYAAIDYGIVSLTDSGQILRWKSTKEKIYHIPFGHEPYDAIADWFTTEDGLVVLNKITQTLKA